MRLLWYTHQWLLLSLQLYIKFWMHYLNAEMNYNHDIHGEYLMRETSQNINRHLLPTVLLQLLLHKHPSYNCLNALTTYNVNVKIPLLQ